MLNFNQTAMQHFYSPEAILKSAEEILRKRGALPASLHLDIDKNLMEEEYEIYQTNGHLTITGGSASAVVFGAGRVIREPEFIGRSAPSKSFRCIYFATHFGNWYDNASEEELDTYLEDLVIWGCNTIKVWFDRHQFCSIREESAQIKIKRLKRIFQKSALLGMKTFLLVLANESYKESPKELRADWKGMKNGYKVNAITGHYHVELCPSKPKALDLLLHWHNEMLEFFADIPLHYFEIFCYDQGGCTCANCAPYGANGYWKIIPRLSELVRDKFSECKIVLSTWRFDHFTDGEWEFLKNNIATLRKYIDILSVDNNDIKNLETVPQSIPAMGFTDISMDRQLPWGGFGVNPYPTFIDEFRKDPQLCGNSAYSEGIYEDLNKIMLLGTEWNTNTTARDMIGEYADYYFGKPVRELVVQASLLMEENLSHNAVISQNKDNFSAYETDRTNSKLSWRLTYKTPKLDLVKARLCMDKVSEAESLMDDSVKKSWRWQIFRLRAKIDLMLAEGRSPEEAFLALEKIYRCGSTTLPCLVPPSFSSWEKIICEGRPSLV